MAGYDDDMGHDEDIDTGVGDDAGTDAAEVNGDQGTDGGDANVQASDASGDTTVDVGGRTDREGGDIVNDFTQDKATDKDEDSLIAYDQYKGDPVYKSGDPSQSVTVGSRQATKDQEDAVGAYVMTVASQRDPQVSTSRTTYGSRQEKARIDDEKTFAAAYTELEGQSVRERVDAVRKAETAEQGLLNRQISQAWSADASQQEAGMAGGIQPIDSPMWGDTLSKNQLTNRDLRSLTRVNAEAKALADQTMLDARIMATERSNRAAAQERARLADLEVEQTKLAKAGDVLSSSTTSMEEKVAAATQVSRWDPSQFYSAIKDPTASTKSKDLEVTQGWNQIKSNLNRINTREYFGIKFGMTHNNKVRRQAQAILTNYRQTYGDQLKDMGRRNSREINSQGFTMGKIGRVPVVGMFFGAMQGIFNALGIAYHATDTELELRALEEKWGITEKPRSDQTPEERKFYCERREGWEWDEDAQVCRMKSSDSDNFSENRFVPQY